MTQPPNTPQQQDIIDDVLAGKSVIVTARAGCAKTSTLERIAYTLPSTVNGLALAFNVKIKKELEDRLPSNWTCLTLNGLGHRAWQAGRGRLIIDGQKPFKMVDQYLTDNRLTATFEEKQLYSSLLNSCRTNCLVPKELPGTGFIPDTYDSWMNVIIPWAEADVPKDKELETIKIVTGILKLSINRAMNSLLDFSDQIYMPVCFGGAWPTYQIKMGDEAQDFSAANHKMFKNVRAPQAVLVGDPKQAIYAFRGAMSDSMEQLESTMPPGIEWSHRKLTKTFRCGKAIVKRQKPFVPDFEAAELNVEGSVVKWPTREINMSVNEVEDVWTPDMIPNGSAILCRNNAPLIRCALRLLTAKRRVTILGNDFAARLKKDISKATKGAPGAMPIGEVLEMVKVFYEAKLEGKKPTASQLSTIQEKIEAIEAFSEDCTYLSDLADAITRVFSDQVAPITLSTGHKSKGLEWDWVMHLNPWMIPSKWAENDPEAMEQEMNLKYVIETRARHTLVLANLDDLEI